MKSASLYEFVLAVLVLWLVMEYVPGGIYIGMAVLLVTALSTPAATAATQNFLLFLQNPGGSHYVKV